MKPRTGRTLLVLALLIAAVVGVLYAQRGKAESFLGPEYRWRVYGPASVTYEWRTVPADESLLDWLAGRQPDVLWRMCGRDGYAQTLGGCAYYLKPHCIVYSAYTEAAARKLTVADGLTLFEHEVGKGYAGFVYDPAIYGYAYGHCAGLGHNAHYILKN